MAAQRLLVIGLDGFEYSLAEKLMGEGRLPHISRLRARSARFALDHGADKYSGLAWEHVSTGLAPSDGGRWSAVTFDPRTYQARQDATSRAPFVAGVASRTVVFDVPYCDLAQAPDVQGLTNWGAHDPGVATLAFPPGLHQEISEKFGPYPGAPWIYGFTWPSVEKTEALSAALTKSVDARTEVAHWLLAERLPDWELALVVVSETHSAIEPLWHGVDAQHPLHAIASAAPARAGLLNVYEAVDRLVGRLSEAFPEAALMLFSMHGMGMNEADVAAMLLLPELLYRHSVGKPYMRPVQWAGETEAGVPLLRPDETWEVAMEAAVPASPPNRDPLTRILDWLTGKSVAPASPDPARMEWLPATRYSKFWPAMRAFALPSFYDGRIRLNLQGREARGRVRLSEYAAVCDELAGILTECRDPISGGPIVGSISRPNKSPLELGPDEADLYVLWKSAPVGLTHPKFGTIGPVPYRRTGGHTGKAGFLFVAGDSIAPGPREPASSFDVVPTIIEMLGERRRAEISGHSLASHLAAQAAE